MLRRTGATVCAACLTVAMAHAAATSADVQAKLDRLESELKSVTAANVEFQRRQEILTQEIRKMRETMTLPEEPKYKSQYGMGPAASKVYTVQRGLSIGGYGNWEYSGIVRDRGAADHDTWNFDRGILYTGYKFSDKLVFNSELEVENVGTDDGGEVALEFAQLDWLNHPRLNFRAGLLLVPVGITNELHEPIFFRGNKRPAVETQIIPSTWREEGVGLFGTIGDVNYRAYVMNSGRGTKFTTENIREGKQEGAQAFADDLSVVARADWQATKHLQVSGSVYHGDQGQRETIEIAPGEFVSPDVPTTVSEAHAIYRNRGLEARALISGVHIGDADLLSQARALTGQGPVAREMKGWYAELAYDLFAHRKGDHGDALIPFFRYEQLDTQARVPDGFDRDPSRDMVLRTFGIDYKPHPQVVLKLDHRDFSVAGGTPRPDELNFGFGYIF